MSRFFINRPIFAWVISILIMLLGVISVINLPIEQYPRIAPPTINVSASYPGANAQTVEDSVVQVIEQRMKGLDGLMYMSSSSSSNGSGSVTLTFENGTDPDTAQVQVQNKLQAAMSALPESVQRQGVNVTKSSSSFLMVQGLSLKMVRWIESTSLTMWLQILLTKSAVLKVWVKFNYLVHHTPCVSG